MGKIDYIVFNENILCARAEQIALATGTKAVSEKDFSLMENKGSYYFYLYENKAEIRKSGSKDNGISADFFSGNNFRRVKTVSYKNPLARALGVKGGNNKKPFILDATAGLGRDSLFLFSLGAKVAGFERNIFLYFLLEISLGAYFEEEKNTVENLGFFNLDSKDFFCKDNLLSEVSKKNIKKFYEFSQNLMPDVVYFDPMYPPVRKKSAKPKKEMVYLRDLNGDDTDSLDVLNSFLERNIKVVVKRPVFAGLALASRKPSYNIETKLVRYDVYS